MTKKWIRVAASVFAASFLAAACGSDGGTAADNADTAASSSASTAAADDSATEASTPTSDAGSDSAVAGGPTDLHVALVLRGVKEEPWYSTMIESLDRAAAASPHQLNITYDVVENVDFASGERVARDLASSGKNDMIIMHSTYSDAVAAIQDEYPDILFAYSGSGNEPTGKNGYWIDVYTHEPAYLAGIIAGMMTKTNSIGGVAAFPFPNVNSPLNAWIEGAKSVNPKVEAKVTYLESWFDPAKAREAAEAQVAAGADMLYAERFGPFEAAQAHKGVYAFGHFSNQNAIAPDVVLASAEARWDPALSTLIDAWYDHMANGTPYDAPKERIMYTMADGGADITLSDQLPADVKDAVDAARTKILSGELVVRFNDAPIE